MKLNEELAEWVAELRNLWSGKIPYSLSHLKRFLYAFLGAFTFFFFLVMLRFREILSVQDVLAERRDAISEVLKDPLILWGGSLGWIIGSSLWIAWLVSWRKQPYSPMRLYLAGLTFPALVSFALMKFFTIT